MLVATRLLFLQVGGRSPRPGGGAPHSHVRVPNGSLTRCWFALFQKAATFDPCVEVLVGEPRTSLS